MVVPLVVGFVGILFIVQQFVDPGSQRNMRKVYVATCEEMGGVYVRRRREPDLCLGKGSVYWREPLY